MPTSDSTATEGTGTLAALRRLVTDVGVLADGLDGANWDAPSPCPDLPAYALVEHLVGGLEVLSRVARGQGSPTFSSRALNPAAAADAYRFAGEEALGEWAVPDRLETEYAMPWGPSTGALLVGFLVLEQAVHGWDLARALGRPADLDADAVDLADGVARGMIAEQVRVPGMFGPEVAAPDGAPPLDRLAAFLGRRP